MAVVVDCSVAIKWLFNDEATPETTALLLRLRNEVLVVPSTWPHEMGNVLLVSERRGRLRAADSATFMETLRTFRIEIDRPGFERGLQLATELGRDFGLNAYDAAYLELAIRMSLPLATLDGKLIAAARLVGVEVLPS